MGSPTSRELTIKTTIQCQARHYYAFIVDFEHNLHIGFYAYFYILHINSYFHSFEQVNLCETSKYLPGLFLDCIEKAIIFSDLVY